MTIASNTSPFSTIADDAPWITWCCKTPVSMLQQQEQTDVRSVSEREEEPVPPEGHESTYNAIAPYVQHRQYNAVLARMNHASCKTGAFAAWKT